MAKSSSGCSMSASRGDPISTSALPTPHESDYASEPGHLWPHNLHENRPGSFVSSDIIFATYQNVGIRAFDIRDPYRPVESWGSSTSCSKRTNPMN